VRRLREEKAEVSTKLEEAYAYVRHYRRKYQLAKSVATEEESNNRAVNQQQYGWANP
jgi:transposase